MSSQNDILYFMDGRIVFHGSVDEADLHRHHLLQIVIGLDGPFALDLGAGWKNYDAVILAPDVDHRFNGRDGRQVLVLLEPESKDAMRVMDSYPAAEYVQVIDASFISKEAAHLMEIGAQNEGCTRARFFVGALLKGLGCGGSVGDLDPRVAKAIEIATSLEDKKISAVELARRVHLSESRFTHLFREQVGMPIRAYLRWMRLKEALKRIFRGESFTEAAHGAGFADSAHLSRTFRQTFGLSPSQLFKNYKDSRFVQVIVCDRP